MNKDRRRRLGNAFDLMAKAEEIINSVMEEEQEALDNLPENLQDGERGEEMEEYIETLEEIIEYLQDAQTEIADI